jgi:hypothetical protein
MSAREPLAAALERAKLIERLRTYSQQVADAFPAHALIPGLGLMSKDRAAEWQDAMNQAAAALAAERAPAPEGETAPTLAQLRQIEWAAESWTGAWQCPVCRGRKHAGVDDDDDPIAAGHTPDCWLSAAIHARETAEARGPEGAAR